MKENKTDALRYLENLLLAIYFIVLFGERIASMIFTFINVDFASFDFVNWYAHIATVVSLAAFVLIGLPCIVRIISRIISYESTRKIEKDYKIISYSVGVLLIGGMIHTYNTILWLQFVAYGGLLLSMLMRSLAAAKMSRSGVSSARLVVSYLYILCFSMAIPVVYDTAIAFATVFIALEIAVSLLMVYAFTVMLDGFYSSGGLSNFNFLLILFTIAADIALLVLRWSESINYFLIIFPILIALFGMIGRVKFGNHQLLWYYGDRFRKSYFEGWYVKLQKGATVLAFIVSFHVNSDGKKYGMMQVVTDGEPIYFQFPEKEFSAREDCFDVTLEKSHFDESGMVVDIDLNGHRVFGKIDFGHFSPLKNDIMGFFANFPLMECKHGVVSMSHTIQGQVEIDGTVYDFDGGTGYIEKDRGNSFPSDYHWVQTLDDKLSLMLAIARIPYAGITFSGCIGVVVYDGVEYRLATYNGVRIKERSAEKLVIKKGKKVLSVTALETNGRPLAAPTMGEMSRTIHESAAAKVRFVFTDGKRIVFDVVSDAAGFEFGE